MNTIKLTVLGLSIFVGSLAFAQEQKSELTKEQRTEERMDKFSKELNLSEDQKVEIIELRKSTQEARLTLKSNETMDEGAKKSAMRTLHMENKAKMAKILTPEQSAKLKEMKAERRANYKQKYPNKEYKGHKKDVKQNHRVRTLEEAPMK